MLHYSKAQLLLALVGLGALLVLSSRGVYLGDFLGAHLWGFVALIVGGALLFLSVSWFAGSLAWDWYWSRRKARDQAAAKLRYDNQIGAIDAKNREQRRAYKEEQDRILPELQALKAEGKMTFVGSAAHGEEFSMGTQAQADHGATSIAAGRDVNYYVTPGIQTEQRGRVSGEPTFDLTFRAAPDDFVHALVTNKTTPAEFHVDVIDVVAKKTQTTPYPVKWRGFAGEDRRVVREALIDLANVVTPGRNRDGGRLVFINPHREKGAYWESGYFNLFSFSKQDGWGVRGVDTHAGGVPDELRFFRERISLIVRAVRLDTQEEITRRVTISFVAPIVDARSQQRVSPEPAFLVQAEGPS